MRRSKNRMVATLLVILLLSAGTVLAHPGHVHSDGESGTGGGDRVEQPSPLGQIGGTDTFVVVVVVALAGGVAVAFVARAIRN